MQLLQPEFRLGLIQDDEDFRNELINLAIAPTNTASAVIHAASNQTERSFAGVG